MRLLNPIDQMFLRLERRNQPMHVGALQLFTLPADADQDSVRNIVNEMRDFTDVQSPFDQRLHHRLGQYFWVDDVSFDIEHHVRHLALPRPGEIRELLTLVSQLHSALLDRSRPLWECYVIEGVVGDRVAVYTKMHHAMMDGVSGMKLMRRSLSDTAQDHPTGVPWHLPPRPGKKRGSRPSPLEGAWRSVQASARQVAAVPFATRELYRAWQDAGDPDATSIRQAPPSILNCRVSGSRRFAAQSYSLPRIKRLAKHHEATVNDIILAMCASALRRYLGELDALPDAPLVTMIPMSLHTDDDSTGNNVAMILASLATDVADPLERLGKIQRSVAYWKRRYKKMTSEQIMAFIATMAAPAGLNLLTGMAPSRQAFNLVISNVPGPQETLYFADAELEGMYPVSIVLDGMALNITITSYRDKLQFGLIACRRSLPSMQRMLTYLADALDDLEPAETTVAGEDSAAGDEA